jgi:hypothetical protein
MAIHSMNNKSPGIDNISTELYKKGGGLLLNKTHSLIKGIWREEKVLTDWKTNTTVPTYKNWGEINCDAKIKEEYHCYVQDTRY